MLIFIGYAISLLIISLGILGLIMSLSIERKGKALLGFILSILIIWGGYYLGYNVYIHRKDAEEITGMIKEVASYIRERRMREETLLAAKKAQKIPLKTIVNPSEVHKPLGSYSHAIKVKGGDLLFVAGQGGIDRNGHVVGKKDLRMQVKQALENIKAILKAQGATLKDVIKMTTYVTDIDAYLKLSPSPLTEYIKDKFPVGALIEVKRLALPEMMVEIEAIALVK